MRSCLTSVHIAFFLGVYAVPSLLQSVEDLELFHIHFCSFKGLLFGGRVATARFLLHTKLMLHIQAGSCFLQVVHLAV